MPNKIIYMPPPKEENDGGNKLVFMPSLPFDETSPMNRLRYKGTKTSDLTGDPIEDKLSLVGKASTKANKVSGILDHPANGNYKWVSPRRTELTGRNYKDAKRKEEEKTSRFNDFFNEAFAKPWYSFYAGIQEGTGGIFSVLDQYARYLEKTTGLKGRGGLFEELAKMYFENAQYYKNKGIDPSEGFLNKLSSIIYESSGSMSVVVPTITSLGQWGLPIWMGIEGGAQSIQEGKNVGLGMLEGAAKGSLLHGALKVLGVSPKLLAIPAAGGTFAGVSYAEGERDPVKLFSEALIGAALVAPGKSVTLGEAGRMARDEISGFYNKLKPQEQALVTLALADLEKTGMSHAELARASKEYFKKMVEDQRSAAGTLDNQTDGGSIPVTGRGAGRPTGKGEGVGNEYALTVVAEPVKEPVSKKESVQKTNQSQVSVEVIDPNEKIDIAKKRKRDITTELHKRNRELKALESTIKDELAYAMEITNNDDEVNSLERDLKDVKRMRKSIVERINKNLNQTPKQRKTTDVVVGPRKSPSGGPSGSIPAEEVQRREKITTETLKDYPAINRNSVEKAITDGGATFDAIHESIDPETGDMKPMVQFTDPVNKGTFSLPADKITKEGVAKKLKEFTESTVKPENPPIESQKSPLEKQPWEMTKDEFENPPTRTSSKQPMPIVSQTYYHGSDNKFDLSKMRSTNTSTNSTTFGDVSTVRHGIFVTDSKDFAGEYGGNIIAVKLKPGKTADVMSIMDEFIDSLDHIGKDRDIWLLANNTKDPWGMFEGELGEAFIKYLKNNGYRYASFTETLPESATKSKGEISGNTVVVLNNSDLYTADHKEIVQKALSEGKHVPEEVLKEYPDLAEKYKKKGKPKVKKKKQPWEMTREEYKQEHRRLLNNSGDTYKDEIYQTTDFAKYSNEASHEIHKKVTDYLISTGKKVNNLERGRITAILRAISEGKPVPKEVLKDYPDLIKNNNKMSTEVRDKILKEIDSNGGITIKIQTGEQPKSGWAVGGVVRPYKNNNGGISGDELDKFINKNYNELSKESLYLGAWIDGKNGWLDVSEIVRRKSIAIRLAKERGEEAVFNIKTGELVRVGDGVKKTGQQNAEFFTGKAKEASSNKPYIPVLTTGKENTKIAKDYNKYTDGGNFTGHISKMIPGFAEKQMMVAYAIVKIGGENFLDIGASEGGLVKTVSANSNIHSVAVDPNVQMKKNFDAIETPDNVEFKLEALGASWVEDDGTIIREFKSDKKFDFINEDFTFQFISNDRKGQLKLVKRNLKNGGLFITSEKFFTDNFEANEKRKLSHQRKFFNEDQLTQDKQEIITGMESDMVRDRDYEKLLRSNFKYVEEFWNAGNFKGYVASNDGAKVDRFLKEVGDLSSEYSDVTSMDVTPDVLRKKLNIDDSGMVSLYHYGPSGLKTIDPKYFGSNKYSLRDVKQFGRNRSMFYIAPEDAEPRISRGKREYIVKIPISRLYPFNSDPLNLLKSDLSKWRSENGTTMPVGMQLDTMSHKITDRGYWGLILKHRSTYRVDLFVKTKVEKPSSEDFSIELGFLGFTPQNMRALHKALIDTGKFTFDMLPEKLKAAGRRLGINAKNFKDKFKNFSNKLSRSVKRWFRKVWEFMKSQLKGNGGFIQVGKKVEVGLSVPTKGEKFMTKVVDLNDRIKRVQEQILEQGGVIPESGDVYLKKSLLPKKIGYKIDRVNEDEFMPVYKKMVELDVSLDEVNEWLHAKHAQERNLAMEANGYEGGSGSGMSFMDALEVLNKLGDKSRELETISGMFYDILDNNLLRAVDYGLMKKSEADEIKDYYSYYVPLQRKIEEFSTGIGTGIGSDIRGKEVKRAKGSEREVLPIVPQIVNKVHKTIIRGEKNKVGLALGELVELNPSPLWKVEAMKYIPRFNKEGEMQFLDPQFKWNDNVIGFRRDGKQYFVTINEEGGHLARAIKETGKTHGVAALRPAIAILSVLSTKYSPEFLPRNFQRDSGEALFNMGHIMDTEFQSMGIDTKGFRKEVFKNLMGSIRTIYKDIRSGSTSGSFAEFLNSGGKVGHFWMDSEHNVFKEINRTLDRIKNPHSIKNTTKDIGEWVGDANEAVELGIRFSTWKELVKRGVSKERAAAITADLTVDFNKMGEWGPLAKSMYLFINPQIQGTERAIRSIVKSKRVRRGMVAMYLAGFFLSLLSQHMNEEGDKAIPDYRKNTRIIFSSPDGSRYVSFGQLPYGFNTPWAAGRYTAEMLMGKITYDEMQQKVLLCALDSFNPLGGSQFSFSNAFPSVVKPLDEIDRNENWMGYTIYPEGNIFAPETPDYQKYWKNTTNWSKAITAALNKYSGGYAKPDGTRFSGKVDISPESLEYFVKSYSGSVSTFLTNTFETGYSVASGKPVNPTHIPFVRDFYGQLDQKRAKESIVYKTLDVAGQKKITGLRLRRFLKSIEWLQANEYWDDKMARKVLKSFYKAQGEDTQQGGQSINKPKKLRKNKIKKIKRRK